MEDHTARLNRILLEVVKLDFVHLAILSVNLSQLQFDILQQAEINRLRSSERAKAAEDQSLTH